jgi:hypothetical protein
MKLLSIPFPTSKTNVIKLASMMRYASSSSASPTTTTTTTTTTAASRLIQRRATTGSVSSVFYLKTLPGQQKQAKFIENVFTFSVGVPIAILGLGGIYKISTTSD